jgi:hypothetical protein
VLHKERVVEQMKRAWLDEVDERQRRDERVQGAHHELPAALLTWQQLHLRWHVPVAPLRRLRVRLAVQGERMASLWYGRWIEASRRSLTPLRLLGLRHFRYTAVSSWQGELG